VLSRELSAAINSYPPRRGFSPQRTQRTQSRRGKGSDLGATYHLLSPGPIRFEKSCTPRIDANPVVQSRKGNGNGNGSDLGCACRRHERGCKGRRSSSPSEPFLPLSPLRSLRLCGEKLERSPRPSLENRSEPFLPLPPLRSLRLCGEHLPSLSVSVFSVSSVVKNLEGAWHAR
jgi:hypothetical protein